MMINKSTDNMYILHVEDNPDDILLTKLAFEDSQIINQIYVVEDGEEALNFLNKKGNYSRVPRPDLILLDLNLPKKNGHSLLAEIKEDQFLKDIPVVVLTTSNYEDDVLRTYKAHANCFITKPVDLDSFMTVVRFIEHFWFNVVTLPPNDN